MPGQPFGIDCDDDALPVRLASKGCFERRDQWHGDVMKGKGVDFHGGLGQVYNIFRSYSMVKSSI